MFLMLCGLFISILSLVKLELIHSIREINPYLATRPRRLTLFYVAIFMLPLPRPVSNCTPYPPPRVVRSISEYQMESSSFSWQFLNYPYSLVMNLKLYETNKNDCFMTNHVHFSYYHPILILTKGVLIS